MKMNKGFIYLRRLAYVMLSLFGLLILLTSTYVGTRTLFAIATAVAPGRLSVSNISGSLTSGLYIHNLIYRDHTGRIQGETIAVKIDLASLLTLHLFIRDLTIDNVSIYAIPTDEAKSGTSTATDTADTHISFAPPSWLKYIDLDNIKITNIHYFKNKDSFKLTSAFINKTSPHHYQYDIETSLGKLEGTAHLSFKPSPSWGVTLKASGKVDSGVASGNAAINYSDKYLNIDALNLSFGDTHLKAAGSIGKQSNVVWNLDIPNIGLFIPDATGRINTDGTMRGTAANPDIKAKIRAKNIDYSDLKISHLVTDINTVNTSSNHIQTNISFYGVDYNDIKIKQGNIDIDTRLVKSTLETQITGHLDQKSQLSGTIKLPDFKSFNSKKQKIEANISLNVPDLSQLPLSIPQVSLLAGTVSANVNLSGKATGPNITVTATINNASAKIDGSGAIVSNINANLRYQPNHPLELTGRLTAGDGTANITGSLLPSGNNVDFKLNIDGQNLLVANTHEYIVTASPNVTLDFTNDGAKISGSVLIPNAKIFPVEFSDVVNIPDETLFVHRKQTESTFYRNLVLDIQAKLGDKIYIRYDNFKTQLHGSLHVTKQRDALPTAVGNLFTDHGSYKAYGTELNIQTGRIIYTGNPITNPGIDVRAIKSVRKVAEAGSAYTGDDQLTVGLSVLGTADKPRLSFFSEPGGLSQKDILSYLIFGYPQSQVGSASALALLSSIAPGGNSSANITNNIQSKLGLDELGMGNTDYIDPSGKVAGNTSTVNVGKTLSDKLSVHYSVGLLYPISILNIRYQINRHLMLQSETSTIETGADIVYSLERK